jgi:hypothetical protein
VQFLDRIRELDGGTSQSGQLCSKCGGKFHVHAPSDLEINRLSSFEVTDRRADPRARSKTFSIQAHLPYAHKYRSRPVQQSLM